MSKKLYVGNLPFSVTDDTLGQMFGQFGTVESARIITDRATGRSRGFGFVEIASDDEAQRAIEGLNGQDCEGRNLVVSEARPVERDGGGHRGGGGGRRGYGGGRDR